MTNFHHYEQPLNEKVRAFLRLEKLFLQYNFHSKNNSDWDNRIAINSILDLLSFTSRSDVKLELLKELERQHNRLERLARRPQIDQSQLSSVLDDIQKRIAGLQSIHGLVGQETKNSELLTAIAQKNSVPGSICDFDLPAFKNWLSKPKKTRNENLAMWFSPFHQLEHSVQLILEVLRHSAEDTDEIAQKGFFQKSLDTNQPIQLIRISTPSKGVCYPEISAGKHRFSVRFMENENPASRPDQCHEDIKFKLRMCSI